MFLRVSYGYWLVYLYQMVFGGHSVTAIHGLRFSEVLQKGLQQRPPEMITYMEDQ